MTESYSLAAGRGRINLSSRGLELLIATPEHGTYKTVKARSRPWLQGKGPPNVLSCFLSAAGCRRIDGLETIVAAPSILCPRLAVVIE